ncbi:NUDIX pyrophosphatase [bacterium]|nr:MAG: NUDIX pyrophosphatase [bacterium]
MVDEFYKPKVVDVYPYCKEGSETFFLLLKRNPFKIYGGQWRMVGGKIEKNELAWQAAIREYEEETQLDGKLWWTVPSLNHFYDHQRDAVQLIPVFAVDCGSKQTPTLNDEHIEYKWVEAKDCQNYIRWPEQNRLILLINELVKQELLHEWLLKR